MSETKIKELFAREMIAQDRMYFYWNIWSSLFYNASVRHKQRECNMSNTFVTEVLRKHHEYNTSTTRMTLVKNINIDNGTRENIFSFLERLIFFFLKELVILDFDFVNFC